MIVIEMNPRVSRVVALASKATGFPIAKIAAKLAVGYTLDELKNDITRETPACFEPTIDYVVTKVPRFAFEKFPEADPTLTTQMKSVGETMAIGRTFKESLQKALRGLEVGRVRPSAATARTAGARRPADAARTRSRQARHAQRRARLVHPLRDSRPDDGRGDPPPDEDRPVVPAQHPRDRRRRRTSCGRSARRSTRSRRTAAEGQAARLLRPAAGHLWNTSEMEVAAPQGTGHRGGVQAGRHLRAPSSRRTRRTTTRPTSPVIQSRNRGDKARARVRPASTTPASRTKTRPALRQAADHDPRRRAEPHRPGDRVRLLLRAGRVRPARAGLRDHHGQLQPGDRLAPTTTPATTCSSSRSPSRTCSTSATGCSRRASSCSSAGRRRSTSPRPGGGGVPIIGTSVDSIDIAEDRERSSRAGRPKLGLKQPANGIALDTAEAGARRPAEIGYPGAGPAQLRPRRPGDGDRLRRGGARTVHDPRRGLARDKPVLIDQFLENATEVDVDCLSDDGTRVVIGGVMQHIEEAGIHSGDSACVIPPHSLPAGGRRRDQASRRAPWPARSTSRA